MGMFQLVVICKWNLGLKAFVVRLSCSINKETGLRDKVEIYNIPSKKFVSSLAFMLRRAIQSLMAPSAMNTPP